MNRFSNLLKNERAKASRREAVKIAQGKRSAALGKRPKLVSRPVRAR